MPRLEGALTGRLWLDAIASRGIQPAQNARIVGCYPVVCEGIDHRSLKDISARSLSEMPSFGGTRRTGY